MADSTLAALEAAITDFAGEHKNDPKFRNAVSMLEEAWHGISRHTSQDSGETPGHKAARDAQPPMPPQPEPGEKPEPKQDAEPDPQEQQQQGPPRSFMEARDQAKARFLKNKQKEQ